MKFTGHDLILQEWNLDVEQDIVPGVVLFILLRLQIDGFSDATALSLVH